MDGHQGKVLLLLGVTEELIILEIRGPRLCQLQFPVLNPLPSAGHGYHAIGIPHYMHYLVPVHQQYVIRMSNALHPREVVIFYGTQYRVILSQHSGGHMQQAFDLGASQVLIDGLWDIASQEVRCTVSKFIWDFFVPVHIRILIIMAL
jgi:hypothetical protein